VKWRTALVALLLLVLIPSQSSAHASNEPFNRGVNVLYYGSDAQNAKGIAELLDTLKRMNVDSILLTYPIYIDDWRGSTIREVHDADNTNPNGDTPTADELAAFITPANDDGFKVMLRPLIDEERLSATGPAGAWRGLYQPSDPDQFFGDLSGILTGTAAIAAKLGVSWIVIGSELNALEKSIYNSYWESIISAMRNTIGNHAVSLTYAQNWDTGMYLGFPTWLSLLDGVSIDAYFPATGVDRNSSVDDVASALSKWTSNLKSLQGQAPGKPLFVTEAGVASQDADPNVLSQPWSWPDASLPVDTDIQSLYTAGACRFFRGAADGNGDRLVSGLFWWQTGISHPAEPADDVSFEFVGKPAADQIAACYAQ
jgi:hypothetical protein